MVEGQSRGCLVVDEEGLIAVTQSIRRKYGGAHGEPLQLSTQWHYVREGHLDWSRSQGQETEIWGNIWRGVDRYGSVCTLSQQWRGERRGWLLTKTRGYRRPFLLRSYGKSQITGTPAAHEDEDSQAVLFFWVKGKKKKRGRIENTLYDLCYAT